MSSITLIKHRLQWVDSLRGIAALLVVILHLWHSLLPTFHLNMSGGVKIISFFVFDYLDFGKIGVVAFFLISGFVIPYSFRNKTNKQFFIGRFFRLYPAYWIAILSVILISGFPPAQQLLINITMFQRFVGVEDLIGAFWTLQIEIIFYIICACFHYFKLLENDKFIVKTIYVFIGLSLSAAIIRYQLEKKIPVALFLALAAMFFGLSWRRFFLDRSAVINKSVVMKLLICFLIALLPITLLAYSKNYGNDETWYRYFFSYIVAFALFFLFSYYKFENKVLLYLGNISYSLYLLHTYFGISLTYMVMDLLKIHNIYAFICFFFFLSFLSASISYFFVEKPCVKLGRKLIGKV